MFNNTEFQACDVLNKIWTVIPALSIIFDVSFSQCSLRG